MDLERGDDEALIALERRTVQETASPLAGGPRPANAAGEHLPGPIHDDPPLHAFSLGAPSCHQREDTPEMTKWEYTTVPLISHALQEILNQWGEEGWELVQVLESQATGTTAYFKREKS